MKFKIIKTQDGSNSIFLPELDETYHSKFGAVNESKHVFIEAGLNHYKTVINKKNNDINILEIGFGTGLNAFLTLKESLQKDICVYYETLEKFPLPSEIINQLNYSNTIEEENYFSLLHKIKWNNKKSINKNFYIHKKNIDIINYKSTILFDIVYFDAFAPDKQPEMWTKEIFKLIFNQMNTPSILVTYSAKGKVRRTLTDMGFTVEKIKGPPGKREMIRAIK